MAKTHKTKTEMLQELESIKGLLLENDDIPLLQEVDVSHHQAVPVPQPVTVPQPASMPPIASSSAQPLATTNDLTAQDSQVNPLSHTQTSLFDDEPSGDSSLTATATTHLSQNQPATKAQDQKYATSPRQPTKAAGENPFLPQHIRERLHGNNPPPLFAHETARKIMNATKTMQPKSQRPRQQLIDDVINSMLPQVESELRHRLFAMSIDELESLLNNNQE